MADCGRVIGIVLVAWGLAGGRAPGLEAAELVEIPGCTLVPADWADGDSFRIRTPAGEEHTVRLYGADCLEAHVASETDARRLRSQRRAFGITEVRGNAAESIEFAKALARQASAETRGFLASPFTIHTSFADGRGDGRFKRIYAFVFDSRGRDLAAHLVSKGLARAFGVSRSTLAGESGDDYRSLLEDLELQAAKRGVGIWAHTDWDRLPLERRLDREEQRELREALDGRDAPDGFTLDPNVASRDDLMRLPGVGEALANRIIEGRPYRRTEDLLRVNGIGDRTLESLAPFIRLGGGSGRGASDATAD
jgi:competence protein ComEA